MTKTTLTPNLSFAIDPKLKQKVKNKAKKNGQSLTHIVTEAFKNYLNGN
jgi:predicted HicB family RNase H-like nuclease